MADHLKKSIDIAEKDAADLKVRQIVEGCSPRSHARKSAAAYSRASTI